MSRTSERSGTSGKARMKQIAADKNKKKRAKKALRKRGGDEA